MRALALRLGCHRGPGRGLWFARFETIEAEVEEVAGTRVKVATPGEQKFRSIEEMNAAPLPDPNTSDFERFLRHCARYWALAPKVYKRGVFRFRRIEEAQHPHQD